MQKIHILWAGVWMAAMAGLHAEDAKKLSFNRDIRPILSENCYACHGPDKNKRKSGLRLDVREDALKELESGEKAIVPGSQARSSLVSRIISTDRDELMPPPKSEKKLTPEQIELLKRWIEEGAEYQPHWAFIAPVRPEVPAIKDEQAGAAWTKNPIDRFIVDRLVKEKLKPSNLTDKSTLIRRVSLDLTGLPPSPEDVAAFDGSPAAYEKLVDQLLASPAFGERMALYWLDLVRYGDTIGYHSDNVMNVSPYRDYVIDSFNANKHFDQFTREQFAGDLLPTPTREQLIASGYNRLLLTTEEGGAQAKEYEAKNKADRVRNASSAWMGATLACAECHDHKFDPYSTKDFYAMAAFFADIKENAIGKREEGMPIFNPEQEATVKGLDEKIAAKKTLLAAPSPELDAAQKQWESELKDQKDHKLSSWQVIGPFTATTPQEALKTVYEPEKEVDLTKTYENGKLKWVEHTDWPDGQVNNTLSGDNTAHYLYRKIEALKEVTQGFSFGSDDCIKVWINGKEVVNKEVFRAAAADQEKIKAKLKVGVNTLLVKIVNGTGGAGFYFKADGLKDLTNLIKIAEIAADKRDEKQKAEINKYYRSIAPLLEKDRKELEAIEKERTDLLAQVRKMLVTTAEKPRVVRVLPRGNWMDDTGEIVEPAVPHFLTQLNVKDRRANRLDFANWLVDKQNPLTARTFVNRLWKLFYGQGISKRLDDLGAQGEWPTHPELLDWLAVEFVESGWDVKHMVRLLVTAQTYQQSSNCAPALREKDPYNRLFARQTPFRLDAEIVRDNALAISGLLVKTVGGASVKPYQPEGYWSYLNFPKREWANDKGDNVYRRGLYTFWQRTFPHPSLVAFDATGREECVCERARSNTPQQALTLLNDPTYVEAARVFAERTVQEGGDGFESRLKWAFKRALARDPHPAELKALDELYKKHLEQFKTNVDGAKELEKVGQKTVNAKADPAELAAWTSITRVILNLHETITRY